MWSPKKTSCGVNGCRGTNGHNNTNGTGTIPRRSPVPVAVVGMACRLPGNIANPSELSVSTEGPVTNGSSSPGSPSLSPTPTISDRSGFDSACFPNTPGDMTPERQDGQAEKLSKQDDALFDGDFLGVSINVLNAMSPETRALLQTVYEATENAGIPIESLAGTKTSVFTGFHGINSPCPHSTGTNSGMLLSSSISHLYDLRGASMSIDTGCSSGLVCLHQACETIRSGGSELSVVGAVNSESSVSVDALVLKSLDAALRDGDRVNLIIKSTSLNHNGRTEGVEQQSTDSQGLVSIIKAALAMNEKQHPGTTLPETTIHNHGCGGTNAHVILEAPPPPPSATVVNGNSIEDQDMSRVFTLSAEDVNSALTMAKNLATHLRDSIKEGRHISPADLAYTLAERRSRLSYKAAIRARNLDELADSLDSLDQSKIRTTSSKKGRLGFVFNGQGAQWHAMGRELLSSYPVFASAIKEADGIIRGFGADWSLEEELTRDAESTRLSEINVSQPATVALQLALVNLLRSWNILPSAVVSHSTGEFAAAYAAGVLSFSQALGIVYHLGDLARKYYGSSQAGAGCMAAAAISAKDVEKYLNNTSAGGKVVVACINSPKSVTLSGDRADLEEVLKRLDDDGVFARKLKVPLAYHSHHMLSFEAEYVERLRRLFTPSKPKSTTPTEKQDVIYVSPVTGGVVASPEEALTPEYYVRNITSPVLFSDAFASFSETVDDVVEIGPHSTLSGPIREILRESGKDNSDLGYMACLKRSIDAIQTMQDLACDLLVRGYPISLRDVNSPSSSGHQHKFIPGLPSYPWSSPIPEVPTLETGETPSNSEETEDVMTRYKLSWELDILHNIPKQIKDSMRITLNQDEMDTEKTLARASYYLISDVIIKLENEIQKSWQDYQKDMLQWMVDIVNLGKQGGLGPGSALWSKATPGMKQLLYDELHQGKYGIPGQLLARVGEKLAAIVRGQTSPTELRQETSELLERYYTEVPSLKSRSYRHLSQMAEMFALKTPGARVLEIGGPGAGGATRAVLEAFSARSGDGGGTLLGQYVLTHKDHSSLEVARRNLASWDLDDDSLIEYHPLDLEQDLSVSVDKAASLSAGSFDLIVASLALGGQSPDTNQTLLYARKLLKPGGKLFMVETTQEKLDVQLLSRTLSGGSSILPISELDNTLRETGFTGVDFEISDCEQALYQSSSLVISTREPESTLDGPSTVCVLYTATVPGSWHDLLADRIRKTIPGISSVVADNWDTFKVPAENDDKIFIFMGNVDDADGIVEGENQASSLKLQRLLRAGRKVLRVRQNGVIDPQDPAQAAGALDLTRRLSSQDHQKRIIRLDFEDHLGEPWTSEKVEHIVHVLQTITNDNFSPEYVDCEYAVKNGILNVPRILPVDSDSEIAEHTSAESSPLQQFLDDLPRWDKLSPEDPMRNDPRFGTMRLGIRRKRRATLSASEAAKQTLNPSDLLLQALETDESEKGQEEDGIVQALQAQLAVLLRIQAAEIDLAPPVATYGVDSIVAIELRTWLAVTTEGKAKLSVLEILNAESLYHVAKMVSVRVGKAQSGV